jgi:hypothetical protein
MQMTVLPVTKPAQCAPLSLEIDGHHVTFGESMLPYVIRTGDPRHGRRVTGLPHRIFLDPEPVDL